MGWAENIGWTRAQSDGKWAGLVNQQRSRLAFSEAWISFTLHLLSFCHVPHTVKWSIVTAQTKFVSVEETDVDKHRNSNMYRAPSMSTQQYLTVFGTFREIETAELALQRRDWVIDRLSIFPETLQIKWSKVWVQTLVHWVSGLLYHRNPKA